MRWDQVSGITSWNGASKLGLGRVFSRLRRRWQQQGCAGIVVAARQCAWSVFFFFVLLPFPFWWPPLPPAPQSKKGWLSGSERGRHNSSRRSRCEEGVGERDREREREKGHLLTVFSRRRSQDIAKLPAASERKKWSHINKRMSDLETEHLKMGFAVTRPGGESTAEHNAAMQSCTRQIQQQLARRAKWWAARRLHVCLQDRLCRQG